MGETSYQIERHIQETRNDLGDNFGELEDKVKKAVDWRAQVEERPGTMLALAFGSGIVLSALLSSGRPSRSAYNDESKPARTSSMRSATPPVSRRTETRQTIDTLTGTLVSVAVKRLSSFIDSLIPGFEHEFSHVEASKDPDSNRVVSENAAEFYGPTKTAAAAV
jgi:hypothetical protein